MLAGLILALWLVWVQLDGGYFPSVWYPSAIALLGILCVCLVGGLGPLPSSRWASRALIGLALLVAWHFLSMLWAQWKGSALEASDELLLLLLTGWIIAVLPWGASSAALLMGAWSLGVALLCVVALGRALGAANVGPYLIENRFASPLGYPNSEATIAVMAFWPSVSLATARKTPLGLQALLLGVAVFLLEFALLPQSRGAIIVFPLALFALLAFSGDRLRLLLRLAVIAPAVIFMVAPVTDVFSAAVAGRGVGPRLEVVARGMLISTIAVGAVGLLIGLLERRVQLSPRTVRAIRHLLSAVIVFALVGAAVTAAVESKKLSHFVTYRWELFKSTRDTPDKPGLRLATAYSDQRYDYARVALRIFDSHPIGGVGAGNYERVYDATRRWRFYSRFPHDIWLRFLSDTGVVGLALFLALIAAIGSGLRGAAHRAIGLHRELVAAAGATATFFVLGASFDWFDQVPALVVPALALTLMVLAIDSPRGQAPVVTRRRWPRVLILGAGAATAMAALAVLVFPYLSLRYVERGTAAWRASPKQAFSDLDRAATLNPLSAEPYLAEAAIALEMRDSRRATSAFRRALSAQNSWYPHLELALLAAQARHPAQAREELTQAIRLDASDPQITAARRLLARGGQIDPLSFNRGLLNQRVYREPRIS